MVGCQIHSEKSEDSTHQLSGAAHLVSSFEGAVKYSGGYVHVYQQTSGALNIYTVTTKFFAPKLTSCLCALGALGALF